MSIEHMIKYDNVQKSVQTTIWLRSLDGRVNAFLEHYKLGHKDLAFTTSDKDVDSNIMDFFTNIATNKFHKRFTMCSCHNFKHIIV